MTDTPVKFNWVKDWGPKILYGLFLSASVLVSIVLYAENLSGRIDREDDRLTRAEKDITILRESVLLEIHLLRTSVELVSTKQTDFQLQSTTDRSALRVEINNMTKSLDALAARLDAHMTKDK